MSKAKFERVFLHCSDSEWGSALVINKWHMDRGWRMCGYNSVITNGYPSKDWSDKGIIIPYLEGAVEIGRPINSSDTFEEYEAGAHVKNYNRFSYGICLIGKKQFSDKVLNSALTVVRYRLNQFDLGPEAVLGHYEKDLNKTCPNIDMVEFRKKLIFNEDYGSKVISVPKEQVSNFMFTKFSNFFKFLFNS